MHLGKVLYKQNCAIFLTHYRTVSELVTDTVTLFLQNWSALEKAHEEGKFTENLWSLAIRKAELVTLPS